jgi:hypothetical protein
LTRTGNALVLDRCTGSFSIEGCCYVQDYKLAIKPEYAESLPRKRAGLSGEALVLSVAGEYTSSFSNEGGPTRPAFEIAVHSVSRLICPLLTKYRLFSQPDALVLPYAV